MKKIIPFLMTAFAAMCACSEKPTLAGSEFSNPNVMPAVADSTWAYFKASVDYQVDSLKQAAIPQLEEQAQRKLTDEELAQLDKELEEQMKEKYAEGKHEIDSLQNKVVFGFVLNFVDDEHITMDVHLKADGDDETEKFDGTYQLLGDSVILVYDQVKDTLMLSPDGKTLKGKFYGSDYALSLEKTK